MNILSKGLAAVIAAVGLLSIAELAGAKPTVGVGGNERRSTLKTTAAQCNPGNATIDLDINNVRARLMTGGDMWWDRGTGTARYEVPKGSGKNALYAGSVWVGGYDEQQALKVAAQMYRRDGNDYWPGPTQVDQNNVNSAPDQTICSDWDKFWKIDKVALIDFREAVRRGESPADNRFQSIIEWPATGNVRAKGTSGLPLTQLTNVNYRNFGRNFAPFVDADKDGLYDPYKGDYPEILGDQYIWWVFNDMGNVKLQTGTNAIGMEVQTSAFAFSSKDYLNDATFIFYKLINRGSLTLKETYMATWTDADLGFAFDDFIGCDTARSLGILYNAESTDGSGAATDYGSEVPMVGVDFFIGPKKRTYGPYNLDSGIVNPTADGRFFREDTLGMSVFNYFNNEQSPIGDPTNGLEIYRVMTGYNRVGQHIVNDQAECPNSNGYGTGPEINFVYFGNPDRDGEWSECECENKPGDRRFVHSSGPFTLEAGGITNDIIIGACWVPNVGGCPNTSYTRIRAADDLIQDLFDNKFKTIEGPESPNLVIREMDRKLIFYITNDSQSTNFQERYGYDTAAKYRVSTPKTRRYTDSLYKFEGYRVFQLKNSTVTPNNIFNERGEVNNALAVEVFQSDIKNGVTRIVNYTGNPDVASGVFDAAIKVNGKDSGIVHSFQLTQDAFAQGADKRFVNYRRYYFVAIAYAYNNYRPFTYAGADTTQQIPYLESSHASNGRVIPIYDPMPNPANGDFGTVLNSDYGSGMIIKRLEGSGNGGLETSFDEATEQQALTAPDYHAKQPVYVAGAGPIDVKVVDPRMVKPGNWELFITGDDENGADPTEGVSFENSRWILKTAGGVTVAQSDRNLNILNEQILQEYGLAISVRQVGRPGDESRVDRNGYINSTISFADPSLAWLAGVNDQEQADPRNWIRAGKYANPLATSPCEYNDKGIINGTTRGDNPDSNQYYENLLSNSTPNRGTWAPATLAVKEDRGDCGFGVANTDMQRAKMQTLPGVDIVFTSDMSKWTKVIVLEMQDGVSLAEGGTAKFMPRSHASWNKALDGSGRPVYSTTPGDTGYSWFPGYAINQETGERVNIVFSEDSYLRPHNGADMIWNPTATVLDPFNGNVIFGGKHYVYIQDTKYDEGAAFAKMIMNVKDGAAEDYRTFKWVGLPTLLGNRKLLPLSEGLIPTETRIRIRVSRPYARYIPDASQTLRNNGYPLFSFNTDKLVPKALADVDNKWNSDKQALLDQIHVTPNPYYGYVAGYEQNRLDTRVRIINLPRQATISIYSLDGTLIRTLTKDNPNQSFVDWDTRNAKGLAIASGMYLIHINAKGIGETVIRWFGAMRPVDITTY